MKRYSLIFLMISNSLSASVMPLTEVMQDYQQALQKLLLVQQQNAGQANQSAFNDPLILATYHKLIRPSVFWINGYASVVVSEVARKFPFYQDLNTLTREYVTHKKNVEQIISLFSTADQQKALEIFYQSLSGTVLQMCFNIVQQLCNQNTLDDAGLRAAYKAYALAWQIQPSTVNISGATSTSAFQTTMTQNMVTLFSNAINVAQTSLASNMSTGVSVKAVYATLEFCYQSLQKVYTNSGDTFDAQTQSSLLAALKQQQQNYTLAQKQQQQAAAAMQGADTAIVLDVNNVATVNASIATSIAALKSGYGLYQTAAASFGQAQDLMDQATCTNLQQRIGGVDMLVRTIQNLWGLYLTDQSSSSSPFYSYPTLASFVQGNQSVSAANAVASLQNLVGMCSDQYGDTNNVGNLFSTSVNVLILPTVQNLISFAQLNPTLTQAQDALFDPVLFQAAQACIQVLISLGNAMINAVNNSDTTQIATAMTYAQFLDGQFLKNQNLNQYVPHLPDSLSLNQTWINFVAQFFYQAKLATSVAQATALAGTVKVSLPVQLSKKDLATMQQQATTFDSQAQAAETAGNWAAASAAYEQALNLYQKLYQSELEGLQQIQILGLANLAKTKFAASNFAAMVQSSGSAIMGPITNIPTSYKLSFDPTLMGTALPACLSSLTAGQSLTTISVADQTDLFALVKGYLVAQKLIDQGVIGSGTSFTNYFSDYTMATMVTSSDQVQAAVSQISTYLNNFAKVVVASASLESDTQVTIELSNFPLAALTAPCSTLSTAATFYNAAAALFAPGTAPLSVGGQTYDPGNDAASQNLMLKNLGYAYLSAAQAQSQQLATLMQQLSTELGLTTKVAPSAKLPKDFLVKFNAIQNVALSIQALLYGQQANNAYGCFVQAGLSSLANQVQQEFIKLYKTQIYFGKKCLIGNPTSKDYLAVVGAVNQAYVSWAAELNSSTNAAAIASINGKIADLYEFAGKQCLNYSSSVKEFPKAAPQIPYMVATQYYKSAMLQYQRLQNAPQVIQVRTQLNNAYFQACMQNLTLYLNVKKFGAVYTSDTAQSQTPISFTQLLQDFNDGTAGPNESNLYMTVQKLLFDVAMIFQHLSKGGKSSGSNSDDSGSSGTSAQTQSASPAAVTVDPNHQLIVQFLSKQGLIDATIVQDFPEIPLSAVVPIMNFVTGSGAYATLNQNLSFATQPAVFQAFNDLMFNMVMKMYGIDYQAITATSTPAQVSSAMQQFLSSISNDAASLSNPSSAYVQ